MVKLLVIRFSALGDVAMLAPVVRATAEEHPEVDITMLSQQRMADLFADMPANVKFHGVDLKKQSLREIVAGLGQYDLVADMHGVWRSLYIRMAMRLKGAKVATIRKGRFARFLFTHGMARKPLLHSTRLYFGVLYCLGLDRNASEISPKIVRTADEKNGIGIAPFAAHEGKRYPLERMEQVVAMLSERNERAKADASERGERVVLFGSKAEAEILESWAKKYKGVESVAGKMSLGEELELMKSLRVMISMDSANMHLASLVGTRVVSIWGATHPNAGFLGIGQNESDCIQRDLKCRPCSIYGKKKCKYGDYRCMDIAPEDIVQKYEDCYPSEI